MKKILLLCISLFFLVGCVTTDTIHCPPKDLVFPADTPFGYLPFTMPKGFFDAENEDLFYMDAEKYKKQLMEPEEPEPAPEENRFEQKHDGQTTLNQ